MEARRTGGPRVTSEVESFRLRVLSTQSETLSLCGIARSVLRIRHRWLANWKFSIRCGAGVSCKIDIG